jgi:hypothetical protein
MAYRPRSLTGRLALYFGVPKSKIRDFMMTGGALICIVIGLLVVLR